MKIDSRITRLWKNKRWLYWLNYFILFIYLILGIYCAYTMAIDTNEKSELRLENLSLRIENSTLKKELESIKSVLDVVKGIKE